LLEWEGNLVEDAASAMRLKLGSFAWAVAAGFRALGQTEVVMMVV
jgi:hypothetical protein